MRVASNAACIDYHLVAHLRERSTYIEAIFADGKAYSRVTEQQGEGKWERDTSKTVTDSLVAGKLGLGSLSEGNIVCPELHNTSKVGTETIEGTKTTRYHDSYSIDQAKYIFPDEKERAGRTFVVHHAWDFWIDSTGLLVQVKKVDSYPPLEGHSERQVFEEVTTISGVGETNTITAPVVP